MSRPVWQRERTWIGAEGVADKVERWAGLYRTPREPTGLEDLLSRPEWKGSTYVFEGDIAWVKHPSGAEARVRIEALAENTCGRKLCKNPPRRCPKCDVRTCSHHLSGIKGAVCWACELPITRNVSGV